MNSKRAPLLVIGMMILVGGSAEARAADTREWVNLPEPMAEHMLGNMRKHLEALNTILGYMGLGEWDKAADLAEQQLGMSSLDDHGARHIAPYYPKGMQEAGTAMHRAASRFALKAEEADLDAALQALGEVTCACVACHSGYRIR